jgi:hypothetical protein
LAGVRITAHHENREKMLIVSDPATPKTRKLENQAWFFQANEPKQEEDPKMRAHPMGLH